MANENPQKSTNIKTRITVYGLIALGLILAVAGIVYSYEPERPSDALVGMEAPEFEFELPSGEQQSLNGLRGKVVLVNFWAYWCEPCIEEMPSLKALEARYADKDFVMLMVHIGDEKEQALKVQNLPKNPIIDVPVSVLSAYGISGVPHSVLIGKNGVVLEDYRGPRDWMAPDVLQEIDDALNL